MPQYSYQCIEEDGGCGHTFSIFLMMSDYTDTPPNCPLCNTFQFVKRDFEVDLPKSRVIGQTLGSLADKNTQSMSKDEREARWFENNKYRFEGTTPGLPDNMERMRDKAEKFDVRGTGLKKKRSPNKKRKK